MLIKAFLYSFRKAWIYKHTGELDSRLSDPDALVNLENLAIVRHPKKVEEVLANLQEVTTVLKNTKRYLYTLAQIVGNEESPEYHYKLNECAKALDKLPTSAETKILRRESTKMSDRILATLLITGWCVSFLYGLQFFIQDLTKREIAFLLDQAALEKYATDPFKRLYLYDRVLKKDSEHPVGLLKSSETMLDIADRRVDLFSLDQGERDIDNFFNRVLTLERISGLDSPLQKNIRTMAAQAYVARGKIFFLRNNLNRAMAELNKENSDDLRSMRYSVSFYEACQQIINQNANEEDFRRATLLLGEITAYPPRYLADLGIALTLAAQGNLKESLTQLEGFLNNEQAQCSSELRQELEELLAEGSVRQNAFSVAKERFTKLIQNNPTRIYSALGQANLLRLEGKLKEAQSGLSQVILSSQGSASNEMRSQLFLANGTYFFLMQQDEKALEVFQKIWEQEGLPESVQLNLLFLLQKKITSEEFINRLSLWKKEKTELSPEIGYFYLALNALRENQLGLASQYFRTTLQATECAEVAEARQELANLQIQIEKQSQEASLLFPPAFIHKLARQLQQEILSAILPSQKVMTSLKWALSSSDERMRSEAIISVAKAHLLTPNELLPYLLQGLQDEAFEVKQSALDGLLEFGEAAVLAQEEVFNILNIQPLPNASSKTMDQIQSLKRTSVKLMENFGTASVTALIKALKDQDKFVRRDAGYALSKLKEKALPALEVLSQKLEDSEIIVRDAAFEAIASLGKESVPVLLNLIEKSAHSSLIRQAIQNLQKYSPEVYQQARNKVLSFFQKALIEDKDPETRRYVAQQLIKLEVGPDIISDPNTQQQLRDRLQELLKTSDPLKQVAGALTLMAFGSSFDQEVPEAITFFQHYLEKSSPDQQKEILSVLTDKPYRKKSFPILVSAFKNKNPHLKRTVGRIFEAFREEGEAFTPYLSLFLKALCKLLTEEDEEGTGLELALEEFRNFFETMAPAIIPEMFALLHHENEMVHDVVLNTWNSKFELTPELKESVLKGLRSENTSIKTAHFKLLLDLDLQEESVFPIMKESLNSEDPKIMAAALKVLTSSTEASEEGVLKRAEEIIALESEDIDEAKENAMILIGKVKGIEALTQQAQKTELVKKLLPTVLGALSKILEDEAQQEQIILALGQLLQEDSPDLKISVLETMTLNHLSVEGADEILQELAKNEHEALAAKAQECLIRRDPSANINILAEWLKSEDESKIFQTLSVLAELDEYPKELLEALIPLTAYSYDKIANQVTNLIQDIKTSVLVELLDSNQSPVVLFALEQLRKKAKKSTELLQKLQKMFLTPYALPALRFWLQLSGTPLRPEDLETIQKLAQIPSLSAEMKMECEIVLAQSGNTDAKTKLFLRLQDPALSSDNTQMLLEKLALVDSNAILPLLTQALTWRLGKINPVFAARLLGNMSASAETAIPILLDLRNDSFLPLQLEVQKAILKIRK